MEVFILMYIAFIALLFVPKRAANSQKGRMIEVIVCTLILVGIQGLRHETIGNDSCIVYRPYFEMLPGTIDSLLDLSDSFGNFETGFIVFNKLIKLFTDNTQIFIFICSALGVIPISYMIYRHSTNVVFSFIIFASFIIYYFGFSGIRQAVAVGISVISYEFILRKKKTLFFLSVILASLFHTSAIMFLIAYPCYHYLKLSYKKTLLYLALFVMVLPWMKTIAITMTSLVFGGDKYLAYLSKDVLPSYNLMILLIGFFLLSLISKDPRVVQMRSLIFLSACFQSLGLFSSAATRLAYYFFVYLSIFLPIAISTSKYKNSFLQFATIAFMIFFFFYYASGGNMGVTPYKFFWE